MDTSKINFNDFNSPFCGSVFIPTPSYEVPVVFDTYVDDRRLTFDSRQLEEEDNEGATFLFEGCKFDESSVGWFIPDVEPSDEVPDDDELSPT